MTLRLHKKRRTTAPKVQAETSRKSTSRSFGRSMGQFMVRSASSAVLAGASLLLLTSSICAQDAEDPARYAPPVHVQPAAWSVLEDESSFPRTNQIPAQVPAQASPQPNNVARATEIANMSQYMRMQNEAVLSSKNAQVNAALYQLQYSQAAAARQQPPAAMQAPQRHVQPPRQQYNYPAPRPQAVTRVAPPVQKVQQPVRASVPRQAAPRQAAPRQVVASRPPRTVVRQQQPQPQGSRGVGLQDRISQAIQKTMARSRQRQQTAINRANSIPARVNTANARTVQYVQDVSVANADPAVPMLADESTSPALVSRKPQWARNLDYRPQSATPGEQVIVPSFVDDDSGMMPTLELASTQEPIGSGVRRPRVTSRSQPMGYATAQKRQVSVFKNASTQVGSQDEDNASRLKQLEDELDSRRSRSNDNELPQRSTGDEPSLLDMDDEDAADEARRARSKLDAELDEIEDEDEDDDLDLDDEDEEAPPVFDERGCEELRSLLIDRSIRDISLDMSPPASPRRYEVGNISRSWTDQAGNVLGTGTMMDLRRGYVILDSGQKIPYAKLSDADWTAIAENWLLPSVCSIGQRGSLQRNWAPQTVTWHASNLCHKPLYFENVQLERYGHSRGPFMQPIQSAFHFFGSIIFLPYNTALHPPNECQYALGYYRPGNCAPWLLDPIPFSRDGIRRQALTSVGLAFIP